MPFPRARLALAAALVAATSGVVSAPVSGAGVPPGPEPVTVRVASYNIHAGAGEDNVFDLDRTAAAIASLQADVVGVEEVDVHWGARSQWLDTLQELGSRLHMQVAFAPIYDLDPPAPGQPRRQYGVGLLSRYPSCRGRTTTSPGSRRRSPTPCPPRPPASSRRSSRSGGLARTSM